MPARSAWGPSAASPPARRGSQLNALNISSGATAIRAPVISTVKPAVNGLESRNQGGSTPFASPSRRTPKGRPAGTPPRRPASASRSRPGTAAADLQVNSVARSKLVALSGRGGMSAALARAGRPQSAKDRGPGRAGAFRPHTGPPTMFRRFYERGDLPLCISFRGAVRKIQWKVSLNDIDYAYYLPVFFDGLRETVEPYKFLAFSGVMDLLEKGKEQILPCIPSLILPMKTNLATKQHEVLCVCLRVMQKLALSSSLAGVALVQYYRQLLGVFSLFASKRVNLGDAIDYGQHKQNDLGVLIAETLEILERTGGEDAFVNIKYMVPTWESTVA